MAMFRKLYFGFDKNPEALAEYKEYIHKILCDPTCHTVICCIDTEDEAPEIIGISCVALATKSSWDRGVDNGTKETLKLNALAYDITKSFDVIKEFNLTAFYSGRAMLVVPDYRRHGIAEKNLIVRRMMCAAHGVPMTTAWMSSFGAQIAAERAGWETLFEIDFGEISRKHDVNFEDVPPTIKYKAGKPLIVACPPN